MTASVAGPGDINPSDATGPLMTSLAPSDATVRAHSATRSPHVHFNVSIQSFTVTHDGHPAGAVEASFRDYLLKHCFNVAAIKVD